jgi:hypothetical protein
MKLELWLKAKVFTIFIHFFLSKIFSTMLMEHFLYEPTSLSAEAFSAKEDRSEAYCVWNGILLL